MVKGVNKSSIVLPYLSGDGHLYIMSLLSKKNEQLNKAFGKAIVEKWKSGRAFDRKFSKHLKALGYEGVEFQNLLQRGRDFAMQWERNFDITGFDNDFVDGHGIQSPLKGDYQVTIMSQVPIELGSDLGADIEHAQGVIMRVFGNGLSMEDINWVDAGALGMGTTQYEFFIEGVNPYFMFNKAVEEFSEYGVPKFEVDQDKKEALIVIAYA